MSATGRDLHIDQALSNMAMGYRPAGFIADMIFPQVPVQKQSDLYYEFSRADRLRNKDTRRAPGAEANRIYENVSSGTFYCANYALKSPVTLEDRENADPVLLAGLINGRTQYILDSLLLDWEIRVANQVTSGTNVGSYSAVGSAWNGAGDVLGDLNTAIDNVHDATGIRPNRLVFGENAWRSARRDSTVRNLIFGTNNGGGYASRAAMADLLDVEEILVGGAYQNTGDEGLTESLSQIWDDNVLAYYAPPAPRIDAPSFGYSFRWARPGIPNMAIERHPFNSRTKSEEIEAGYYQDELITGADYGYLLVGVNSSQ